MLYLTICETYTMGNEIWTTLIQFFFIYSAIFWGGWGGGQVDDVHSFLFNGLLYLINEDAY